MKDRRIEKYLNRYNDDIPRSMSRGKYRFIFFMSLPALFGLVVWYFGVNINSILIAFQDPVTDQYSLTNFIRLYNDITSESSEILPALKNTLLFFVLQSIVLPVVVYFIAYAFFKKIRMGGALRFILFIPSIVSGVVFSTLFINIVSPAGPISYIMNELGLGVLEDYLHKEGTAIWVIILFCFWTGLTGNLLLLMGTFNRIPKEVIEAAHLDGVGPFQELWYIVTPMVWPTLSTLLMLSFVTIFTASGPILLFTNGAYDTYTISFWIYDQVKNGIGYNYPAAVGLAFSLIGLPIIMLVWKLMDRIQEAVEY